MNFSNLIFRLRQYVPYHLPVGNKTYELKLLNHFQKQRERFIERIAGWSIKEIDQRLSEYQEEIFVAKAEKDTVMLQILEEKLSQFYEARNRIGSRQ